MEPQRRDLAFNAYLKEHPNGNFARFCGLSQAGKRSYGDPTAGQHLPTAGATRVAIVPGALPGGVERVARVGAGQAARGDAHKELCRKIAWAVGSTYHVPYVPYNTWPADYARRAAARLIEIHGEP